MIKVKADNPDVGYAITRKVTDSEGNEITDQNQINSLVTTVTSSDENVVKVTPDADPSRGSVSFVNPGVASITASIAKTDGTILGSGSVGVTVVTGDPSAVSDIALTLEGLTDEPANPEEAPVVL